MSPDRLYSSIEKQCRKLGIKDPLDLPNPSFEPSSLQDDLVTRAKEHAHRDLQRDLLKDRSSYVNGVLFGFDPDRPLSEQSEGWRESVTPTPEDLADPKKRAARARSHVERRHRGDDA